MSDSGYHISTFVFAAIYLLEIIGFFSPHWDDQCPNNKTAESNRTCFYQGLFYGCDEDGACHTTGIIDSRVFGLNLTVIILNIIVCITLFQGNEVCSSDDPEFARSVGFFFLTFTEILMIASTLIFWIHVIEDALGWSFWLFSWSAVVIMAIVAITIVGIVLAICGKCDTEEYVVYYWVVKK